LAGAFSLNENLTVDAEGRRCLSAAVALEVSLSRDSTTFPLEPEFVACGFEEGPDSSALASADAASSSPSPPSHPSSPSPVAAAVLGHPGLASLEPEQDEPDGLNIELAARAVLHRSNPASSATRAPLRSELRRPARWTLVGGCVVAVMTSQSTPLGLCLSHLTSS
jgi:hypothetical protein